PSESVFTSSGIAVHNGPITHERLAPGCRYRIGWHMPPFGPLLEGFALGASLIIAIGAQNAFVLRQGLKRQHVFLSAAFCSLADLALISGGVFGLGALVREQAWFLTLMTWGGAAFLCWYGTKAARRAW